MTGNTYSCERACPCQDITPTKFIIITGGPGAGKTATLEFIRKVFCQHVAILPEAASILFGGGYLRLNSISARKSAQRMIFSIQKEMQTLVQEEKKWSVGLCDRGTLDGIAYWPNSEASFFKEVNTSKEKEYSKYAAVIHLNSPTICNGYNHDNPVRIETAEEASIIDRKIADVWKDHPNYHQVTSSSNFMDKIYATTTLIQNMLPECCRNHLMT